MHHHGNTRRQKAGEAAGVERWDSGVEDQKGVFRKWIVDYTMGRQ